MSTTITYDQARRHVERKIGFLIHLAVYITVNAAMIFINLQLGHGNWSVWPLFGWGIGVFFHGLGIYTKSPGNNWKQRMIQAELEKHQ